VQLLTRPRPSAVAPTSSARPPIPTSARCAWDCPAPCRYSTRRPLSSPRWPRWPSTARLRERSSLRPARTTSIPDCAKGYQISQFRKPRPSTAGSTSYPADGSTKRIGITSAACTWKRTPARPHEGFGRLRRALLIFDLKPRCGTPLAEIVLRLPDIRDAGRGLRYLTRLKEILLYCDASPTATWSEARCAATCKCQRPSQRRAGNLAQKSRSRTSTCFAVSSPRRVGIIEIERQIEVVESGGSKPPGDPSCGTPPRDAPIPCAPRSRPTTTVTFPSRTCRRSSCHPEFLAENQEKLPELPEARRARMIAEYELAPKDAFTLTRDPRVRRPLRSCRPKPRRNPRRVANLLLSELVRWDGSGRSARTGAVAGFDGRPRFGRRSAR